MDTLVLSTLLANSAALVAILIGLSVGYFRPDRHETRPWVRPSDKEQPRAT